MKKNCIFPTYIDLHDFFLEKKPSNKLVHYFVKICHSNNTLQWVYLTKASI